MISPISVPITGKFIQDASYYASRVVFSSLDSGMRSRFGNGGLIKHLLGKMGELAFYRFCMDNVIPVRHTPFRDDYTNLNDKDDFQLILRGKLAVVEVKTATLKDPLKIPNNQVVFYNKKQYNGKTDHRYIVVFAAANSEMTQIVLLGWISAPKIADHSIRTDIKSPAYAIPVRELRSMETFLEVR